MEVNNWINDVAPKGVCTKKSKKERNSWLYVTRLWTVLSEDRDIR